VFRKSPAVVEKDWRLPHLTENFKADVEYGKTETDRSMHLVESLSELLPFAKSIASGFEGLAAQPIAGAEREGAAGFFKGVGRGLVGAVTKPMVGVFDLASNVTEGIRNGTSAHVQSSLERVRPPRFVSSEGILRPYRERDAKGQQLLRDLENKQFADESYTCHMDVTYSDEPRVLLLTSKRIMQIQTAAPRVEWDFLLFDLKRVELTDGGFQLINIDGKRGPFIPVRDRETARWFLKHVQTLLEKDLERRRTMGR